MISEDVFGLVGVPRTCSNKAKQTRLSEVLLEGVRLISWWSNNGSYWGMWQRSLLQKIRTNVHHGEVNISKVNPLISLLGNMWMSVRPQLASDGKGCSIMFSIMLTCPGWNCLALNLLGCKFHIVVYNILKASPWRGNTVNVVNVWK